MVGQTPVRQREGTMSIVAAPVRPAPVESPRTPAAPAAPAQKGFLFGPWIDLLAVANLFWPVLVLALLLGGPSVHQTVGFWTVYLLLTPHRWITLVLVFFDP